jgi:hypothetical protein
MATAHPPTCAIPSRISSPGCCACDMPATWFGKSLQSLVENTGWRIHYPRIHAGDWYGGAARGCWSGGVGLHAPNRSRQTVLSSGKINANKFRGLGAPFGKRSLDGGYNPLSVNEPPIPCLCSLRQRHPSPARRRATTPAPTAPLSTATANTLSHFLANVLSAAG